MIDQDIIMRYYTLLVWLSSTLSVACSGECGAACKVCDAASETCIECHTGHFLRDGSCPKCSIGCSSCSGSANSCSSCSPGHYLQASLNARQCVACGVGCFSCSPVSRCDSCFSPAAVVSRDADSCEQCAEHCLVCDSGSARCAKCRPGFSLVAGSCRASRGREVAVYVGLASVCLLACLGFAVYTKIKSARLRKVQAAKKPFSKQSSAPDAAGSHLQSVQPDGGSARTEDEVSSRAPSKLDQRVELWNRERLETLMRVKTTFDSHSKAGGSDSFQSLPPLQHPQSPSFTQIEEARQSFHDSVSLSQQSFTPTSPDKSIRSIFKHTSKACSACSRIAASAIDSLVSTAGQGPRVEP